MDLVGNFPKLDRTDFIRLNKLRRENPQVFFINNTYFFIKFMKEYISMARVFRVSIMGETRQGKSEIGSTISFNYKSYFNACLRAGIYNNIISQRLKSINLKPIDFGIDNVFASQFDYSANLKAKVRDNTLLFGQIWQIDEDRRKIGGIGSYSERIEGDNLNNIIAKFMQSEIWITPDKMITQNCPYGLYAYKKDIENRVNWCLLYKIEMLASGGTNFEFMGWVCVPLHNNKEFRIKYNEKKDLWIEDEIIGSTDGRMGARHKVSEELVKSNAFELNDKGNFKLSRDEQISYLETLIVSKQIQNFNEVEKIRIVDLARSKKKMENV